MNTTEIFRNYPLNLVIYTYIHITKLRFIYINLNLYTCICVYIYAFWEPEEITFSKWIQQKFLEIIHSI